MKDPTILSANFALCFNLSCGDSHSLSFWIVPWSTQEYFHSNALLMATLTLEKLLFVQIIQISFPNASSPVYNIESLSAPRHGTCFSNLFQRAPKLKWETINARIRDQTQKSSINLFFWSLESFFHSRVLDGAALIVRSWKKAGGKELQGDHQNSTIFST